LVPDRSKLLPDESLIALNQEIVGCRKCPRLIRHCTDIAATKRRAYLHWDYWGKPVPSFGDPSARMLILGLAPAAHGANRTGRMFTGDRSGDFLYRALHRAGFASQPDSAHASDGLRLSDAWITAAGHCAPPGNKPSPLELRNCRPYLERELQLLRNLRLVVVLGKIAFDAYLALLRDHGALDRISNFRFGHNVLFDQRPSLLCSYHPSQQNTSTGKLTEAMLDAVFDRAAKIIRSEPNPAVRPPSFPPNAPPRTH
jgi:uracil-DNA glycosylase family 4